MANSYVTRNVMFTEENMSLRDLAICSSARDLCPPSGWITTDLYLMFWIQFSDGSENLEGLAMICCLLACNVKFLSAQAQHHDTMHGICSYSSTRSIVRLLHTEVSISYPEGQRGGGSPWFTLNRRRVRPRRWWQHSLPVRSHRSLKPIASRSRTSRTGVHELWSPPNIWNVRTKVY
jgi:hypothetical protein